MPVIGRLDDQVDKVLITPLERGRERETPHAPSGDEPPPPLPSPEPTSDETSPPRDELPVWLL